MKQLYTSFLHRYKFSILFIVFFSLSLDYSQAQTEIATAKQYLKDNAQKQKLVDADINEMTVSSAYLSPTTGWYHIYFNQNYQSVEVYNSMINMVLQQNQVQHTVGNFIPNIASKANSSNVQSLAFSPLQALQKATSHLKLTASDVSKIKEIGATKLLNGTVNKATFFDAQLSDENIEVKLYWLPVEIQEGEKTLTNVKLSWNVKLLTKDKQNSWSVHVDALSGNILRQNDEVIHCNFGTPNHTKMPHDCSDATIPNETKKLVAANNYNVFDIPLESPSHGSRTLVSSPYTRFVPSGTGPGATNGWHNDGTVDYTTTRGNNVYAKEDLANTNGTGASPSSPILEFDHPYTFGVSTATGNQNAAITNLFYWNNLIHDILWKYGFDEPSGNFQNYNQGRGGAGNDFVYADAQDGGGSNNANFSTPADGSNGRMQMYLWSNAGTPSYQPDGDFDNGIIAHEYGHGWSTRLTGGPANSSCLQNGEQGGEGWSDYAALMFGTNWAALTPSLASANIPRGIGTYALGQPITGAGIRPYRYSYDKANVNNVVTYAKVADLSFSQPHGIGSIWATMLWDMTWEIILQDNIIVSNIYNTPTAVSNMRGNIAALKLVNEGLRLQPCSPSFVEARNAILSADQMLFGGRYRCAISRAFSRRGLGLNASTGITSNDRIITEDFTPIAGNGLSSATNLSICSGNVFTYTATSSTNGTTFTWTRPAVAGISNVAKSGNNAFVTDTLINTTTSAIAVTYYFTLTPDLCGGVPAPQAVSVIVNPTVIPTVGSYTICQNGTVPGGAGFIVPQVNSTLVNGILTTSSPVFGRGGNSGSYYYKAYSFVAPSSGTVTFETTDALLSDGGNDTYLYLYQTSFNPASPTTNLIAYDDDSGVGVLSYISQTLTSGTTYIIVATTYQSSLTGTYRLQASIPIFSNTVSWYKNASGGTPLVTGSLFNPVGVAGSGIANTAIAGTTNFYVTDEANPNCRTVVTFKIDSLSVGGNVLGGTTVCAGATRIKLTLSGKTGSVLKWQVSPMSNFSVYSDIANTKDSLIITNAVADTFYRAVVKNGLCLSTNSNPANILVTRPTIAGTISSSSTVCSGINSGTVTLSGNRGSILRWESSIDNFVTNTPIANTTTAQSFSNLTQTTKYRAIVQNGVCAIIAAAPAIITVTSPTVGGAVTSNATVCSGVNTGSVTLSGHTGSILSWESSIDNFVTIVSISNTTTSQTYSNLSQSIKYRAVVQNGICSTVNSSPVEITVVQLPTIISQNSVNPTTCGGNNGSLSFRTTNLPGGTYSFNYATVNPISTNTISVSVVSDSFKLSNLSERVYNNFVISNLGCTGSTVTDIVLYDPFPTALSGQTICYNTTASLSANCLDGTVKWYSPDGTTLLGSGSTFTTSQLTDENNTFNVRCETATCQSVNKQVSVLVLPAVIAPIVQSDVTINLMASITLTATGCEAGNTLNWYKSVDNMSVTMPVIPLDITQYYAKCHKIDGTLTCTSVKSGDVTVNIIPIIVSIATGDWESPTTWNAGRVPKSGDFVIIDQDHTVTLNGETSIKTIDYRGTGTLKYQSASCKLNTGF
jgi:hypothetical protein